MACATASRPGRSGLLSLLLFWLRTKTRFLILNSSILGVLDIFVTYGLSYDPKGASGVTLRRLLVETTVEEAAKDGHNVFDAMQRS